MKIISWNVKVWEVTRKTLWPKSKDTFRKHNPTLTCYKKPKKWKLTWSVDFYMGKQKPRLDLKPGRRHSGGYVSRVEGGFTWGSPIEYGIFSLCVKFGNKQEDSQWWLSCIYGPSVPSNKYDFWIDLTDLGNLIDSPWCVGSDFNEILYSADRKGSTRMNGHSKRFHNWVLDFSLIDLALTNLRHTWSNFRANALVQWFEKRWRSQARRFWPPTPRPALRLGGLLRPAPLRDPACPNPRRAQTQSIWFLAGWLP